MVHQGERRRRLCTKERRIKTTRGEKRDMGQGGQKPPDNSKFKEGEEKG